MTKMFSTTFDPETERVLVLKKDDCKVVLKAMGMLIAISKEIWGIEYRPSEPEKYVNFQKLMEFYRVQNQFLA